MPLQKEIIVLGDIEMGGGNLTDDFIADKALAGLIRELSLRKHPLDLIFNGDTFDFLKCPSQLKPETVYPRHITKDVSLAKLRLIYKAHRPFFAALQEFLSSKNKCIYFLTGNHDHDLFYPEVQKEIQKILGDSERIKFLGLKYIDNGVYVEHGQQYDFLFAANFEKLFLKHKGESILNFPFVTLGLISAFMRLKEQHPFMERIFPRPELLTHHRVIAKKINWRTSSYFLKSILFYPFRFYSDPTYSFPTGLVQEFFRRVRTFHWDVDNIMATFIKKREVKHKIIILGHVHEKHIRKGKNRVIIHPGSWRDEYDFQPKTRELVSRSKRYVCIKRIGNELSYEIIDCPHRRSLLDFDDVLHDELKYVKLAAKEEEFTGGVN